MATSLKYPYLLSKTLDPIFGIFVGTASFYVYERRQGREKGHTLLELIQRRYAREMAKFQGDGVVADANITSSKKEKRAAEAAIFENSAK
ncbi:uncharacterized protein V1516DRAFT_667711 [Lipomyces oligophaga]|uniref:uncharacterized protein n=1 Tax=Lipomyces oligophaga TaxID=45792 RepID=UPI0034CDD6E4